MTREETLEFSAWLEVAGIVLYGQRVAVLRDEAGDFAPGSSHIVVPESHKKKEKKGTVVMVGHGVRTKLEEGEEADDLTDLIGLNVGDKVLFNVYNTLEVALPTRDGKLVRVDIFHVADIYFGFRPDREVEPV